MSKLKSTVYMYVGQQTIKHSSQKLTGMVTIKKQTEENNFQPKVENYIAPKKEL